MCVGAFFVPATNVMLNSSSANRPRPKARKPSSTDAAVEHWLFHAFHASSGVAVLHGFPAGSPVSHNQNPVSKKSTQNHVKN